jgi:hypothetical protein
MCGAGRRHAVVLGLQRPLRGGAEHPNDLRDPTQVGTATDWAQIANTRYGSCGVKTGGTLRCFGTDMDGITAQGTFAGNHVIPTQVGAGTTWVVVTGIYPTCAP